MSLDDAFKMLETEVDSAFGFDALFEGVTPCRVCLEIGVTRASEYGEVISTQNEISFAKSQNLAVSPGKVFLVGGITHTVVAIVEEDGFREVWAVR
jgi:hypothetical protein